MAEIKLFYHKNGIIRLSRSLDFLKSNPIGSFLWIDLNDVDEEIENELEDFLKIYIQEEEEMIEIEVSSRYIETNDTLVINSNFLLSNFESDPVSFILKNNILVTVRSQELISFHETVKKISANPKNYPTGADVLVALLETRVEFDADMIENMTQKITHLSNSLNMQGADRNMLNEIKNLQEKTMMLRENVIDKQRTVSSMLRSDFIPKELQPKLSMIIKDINSLIEHINFSFDRLDYLQDTFLGYVNIEQNNIIKIFTIVSVIFMPPTLIASIYGMNFSFMPELGEKWGYPFAIILMVVSVVIILIYFKKKKLM
ncbi:MAG TPA: magnesium and cobalt transport protein CorA [Porphyromonadaceae bacterium]|jgi:magnesium transporter|uniref:magnesium/cobalt transporter CorA n=1 Tax=Limibacterium fermenti TaxID=3229863 RepID=UPI000E925080|nr:magnesium and cobalt transport protein CorA [Porphyromonadaceae bacterium]HBL35114.1 magnesium and cobalt transport protein CorA [Porphyromonadaceae bacterium]HBX19302.1 magnesium and cobalt transport protein CorA [Porphyromonadaceae bacterium]HBX45203.1 magnesium and cobalt transport protein CorA [Porphyromonadaceae bacterium]HCM20423.1 magnesium and cobalt transport protein CorA [Porphyromonadaceae bacterium]